MKKIKGFTLAEVLVATAIIGILAAITIPPLVQNIQKAETGPKLSRAVQQIETGSMDYFDYKSKGNSGKQYTKFSDIDIKELSLKDLATFWGLTPITNGPSFNIDEYNEYAYIQQPLLIQSAYAAVQNNNVTVDPPSVGVDPPSVGGDTGVGSTIGNGLGNNGTTTVVGGEDFNPDGTDNRVRCDNMKLGEPPCYADDPSCYCYKGPVAQPGCNTKTEDLVDGVCVPKCPEGKERDNNGLCASKCPENAIWQPQYKKCMCAGDYDPKFNLIGELVSCNLKLTPPDPEPEPEPEPDPTPVTSDKVQFHSKKGGYDVLFEDNKIDTTGKTKNEDIVVSFYLDTNGTKNKPNMKGKDLFKFKLRNDGKLEPEGLKDSSYAKNCADSGVKDGLACTARIIRDGYKIKY